MIIVKNSWQTPRYKTDWRDLCALLPAYLSGGINGSLLYYADGTVEQSETRLSRVLGALLTSRNSSKSILQERSRWLLEQLGRSQQNRLPLLLTQEFYLVPVKARQPETRSHGADGYVVYAMVEGIKANDHGPGTKIFLRNRQELLVLDSIRTLRDNLRMTAQLSEAMQELELFG